jgi:hypothetical protein
MFPFGSITSLIPLFVLAFAYMLFVGANTVSKVKTDEPDNAGQKIIFEKSSSHTTKTCTIYPDPQPEDITTIDIQKAVKLPPGESLPDIQGKHISVLWVNFVTARPPPVLNFC